MNKQSLPQPTHFKKRLTHPWEEEMFKSFITIEKKELHNTINFYNPEVVGSSEPDPEKLWFPQMR